MINFKTLYDIFRDISTVVHSSTSVDEVLELVVWKTTSVLGAKGTVLRIMNTETQEFELFASYGLGEKYLSKSPATNQKMIKELCRQNKPFIIDDIAKDPRVQNPQVILQEGITTLLDIPIILRDDMIGIIRIFFGNGKEFTGEELDFVVAIAEQCACAIDKARMIEEKQIQYDQLALHTEKLSALGRMAGGIAHEINNPLAGILLFSTNMRKKLPEESPLKENLEVIIRESMRCKGIIQDLLEFSRDKDPQKASGSLNDIIDKALSLLENEFRIHHISLEKNLSPEIPDMLLDMNLLQQVFFNFLINAVEAIQENGVITIKSRLSQNRKNAIIEIEDTGPGISSDHLGKIFEPFFSTKSNGTGLGLSVSYGIVQNHGGNIRVTSLPGSGAHFIIDIPIIAERGAQ